MAVLYFKNLNWKEAECLADLAGISRDLETTIAFCDILTELLETRQGNQVLLEAVFAAALVRYIRPFSKGVRAKIPDCILSSLPPDLSKFHELVKNLRDKYIAHSVNAFEENQVVAYLRAEEGGPPRVDSISVQETRLNCLAQGDIKKLKELCNAVKHHVSALRAKEESRLLELARHIPVENLYSQVDPPAQDSTMKDVRQGRKRRRSPLGEKGK